MKDIMIAAPMFGKRYCPATLWEVTRANNYPDEDNKHCRRATSLFANFPFQLDKLPADMVGCSTLQSSAVVMAGLLQTAWHSLRLFDFVSTMKQAGAGMPRSLQRSQSRSLCLEQ